MRHLIRAAFRPQCPEVVVQLREVFSAWRLQLVFPFTGPCRILEEPIAHLVGQAIGSAFE